ncbi:hypothetical protein [Rhizobium leguminosarum]|uniref:hypothetical protein n=1 Tax=Rhizobium leguminosarum TaxID=384 RepID=UPI003F9E0D14
MVRTDQQAQKPIPFNTPIVGNPWHDRLIIWKDPTTWHEPLSSWLMPMVAPRRKLRLKQRESLDLCWDDPEWMERLDGALTDPIEDVVEKLAEDLGSATLETYHGCRVHDAGVFHRDGLRINDPEKLEAEIRRMVRDEPALHRFSDTVESMIAEFDARDRDVGRIWLCADEDCVPKGFCRKASSGMDPHDDQSDRLETKDRLLDKPLGKCSRIYGCGSYASGCTQGSFFRLRASSIQP